MRRILGPALILVVAFFAVNMFLTANTGTDLPSIIKGSPAPATTPTEAPQATMKPSVPTEPATAAPESTQGALTALDAIPVTTAARIPDYDRKTQFGPAWEDVDGNSCDTRNDVLARDMTGITRPDGCKVLAGILTDPYTGKTIAFQRDVIVNGKKVSGNSQAVQIDHIVALSLAWKSGAYAWTQDERVAFANDPMNLLASDGPANNRKSDRGPGSWMPHLAGNTAYDCSYAQKFVAVLVKYGLTATAKDVVALGEGLKTCG